MRWIPLLVSALLVVCVAGCRGPQQVAEDKPPWIVRPEAAEQASKYISAVGAGTSGPDSSAKLQEAEYAAREELATRLTDYVAGALRRFLSAHPAYGDPSSEAAADFVKAVSVDVSNAMLRETERHESWHDTRRDAIYVLYRVAISVINERTVEAARRTADEISPFAESQQEVALEGLGPFLDGLLRQRVAAARHREKLYVTDPFAAAPPEWRTTGRHPDYPPERFLTVVGLGEGRAEARVNARVELCAEIDARIAELWRELAAPHSEGPLASSVRQLQADALALQEVDLPASKTVELWYDPVIDMHYVLCVLDRVATRNEYIGRAQRKASDAVGLLESASNHHKADNYLTALQEYLQALVRCQEALKWQLAAMAVSPTRADELVALTDEASVVQAKAGLRELLAEFSLTIVSGDNQWTAPQRPLPEVLVARLTAGEDARPVKGVPVRFRFAAGSGLLKGAATTDADGTVGCTVQKVDAYGKAFATIKCAVAPGRLVPEADLSLIDIPSVTFTCVLRAKENTFFAVHVDERIPDGGRAVTTVVQDALKEALAAAGFKLVDDSLLPEAQRLRELAGDAEAAQVLSVFGKTAEGLSGKGFLIVVVGQARSDILDTADTSVGRLYIVATPVELRALDAAQPRDPVVLRVNAVGKDAFTDNPGEAVRRARVKAGELIARKLIAGLNEKFGAR